MKNRLIALLAALALFAAPAFAAPAKKGTHPGSAGSGATAPVSADPAPLPPPKPSAAPVAPAASPAPTSATADPIANVPGTVIAVPGASPVGSPTFVTVPPPAPSGGFIQIGKIFGETMQPYIDALIQAIALAFAGWIVTILSLAYKRITGKELEAKNRDAITLAVKNQAAGLLAAGAVQMQGTAIHVSNADIANAANKAIERVPEAFKQFGLSPADMEKKVMEAIPQTVAGAAIIAQAHAEAPPVDPALAPVVIKA